MRFESRSALLAMGLLAGMVAGIVPWATRPALAETPPPPATADSQVVHPPGYVGQAACVACHPGETAAWRQSHHAGSMQEATDATVLGDFNNASITVQGLTSTFFRRDGKFFVRTEGSDGELKDFAIAYTFGLQPLQQYLIPFPGGRFQALGLAWDSRPRDQGGQRWFSLYPDERIKPGDPLHWTGRDQTWNYMCAACHSTGLRKTYEPRRDDYHTTWSDLDVACEACHGPGAGHVAWASNGRPADRTGGVTKGFAWLPHEAAGGQWGEPDARGIRRWSGPPRTNQAEQVCFGCHARSHPLTEDAEPGKPLLDSQVPALLDQGLYRADGQIEDEVFEYGSFQQSRMHAAGVSCLDCHEPHGATVRAPGNLLCGQCHEPATFDTPRHHHHQPDSAGAQCVACHMPSRTYMQVHLRRDHSFRLPRPDLSEALGTPNACTQCHQDRSATWATETLRTWGAKSLGRPHYAAALAAAWRGESGADARLAALASDSGQAGITRATALTLLARTPGRPALEAITPALADAEPLLRLGAVRALEPYPPALRRHLAAPLLRDPVKAVRIEAARLLAALPAEMWSADDGGALKRGLDDWVAAELVSAERPESHLNLGALWAELGQAQAAETAFRTALALDPHFVPSLLDLADLYRSQHRDAEAEAPLRQAVASAPEDADAHYALGLWLLRQKRTADALVPLAQAARLRPEDQGIAQIYGLALRAVGSGASGDTRN